MNELFSFVNQRNDDVMLIKISMISFINMAKKDYQ